MWQGLGEVLEAFQHDDNVRVMVMKGPSSKAFASGADISKLDKPLIATSWARATNTPAWRRSHGWWARSNARTRGLVNFVVDESELGSHVRS